MFLPVFLLSVSLVVSVRGACDTAGLQACDSEGKVATALLPWAAVDPSTGTGLTAQLLDSTCPLFKTYMSCAQSLSVDTCSSSTNSFALIYNRIKGAYGRCNNEGKCNAQMTECALGEAALFGQWAALEGTGTLPNTSYCGANDRFAACAKGKMDVRCMAFAAQVAEVNYGTGIMQGYCQETGCSGLNTCRTTFQNGKPSIQPFNAQTCTLWKDFVSCSESAVNSCPALKQPVAPADVAEVAQEVCTMISGSTLYGCQKFQDCVKAIEGWSTVSPFTFCLTAQVITGCIGGYAHVCNATNPDNIFTQANAIGLKLSGMGCGNPYTNIYGCDAMVQCFNPLNQVMNTPQHTFAQRCIAIKNYQTCAHNATQSCGLTIPSGAKHPGPKLDILAGITTKVCDAMNGQSVATCDKFINCIDGYLLEYKVQPMPKEPGEGIVGNAWCPVMTRAMECAMFYEDQCPISASLKASLGDRYNDLVNAGCNDTYAFQSRYSSGANSMAAVTLTTLVLSAFAVLLRLQ